MFDKLYNLKNIEKLNISKKTDGSFFAIPAHFSPILEIQPKALLSSKLFNQKDITKEKDLLKIKIAQLKDELVKDELVKGELDEPRNKKSIRFGKESISQAKLVGTSAMDIELEIENLYGEKARIFANDATGIEGTQSMVKYSLFGDPRIDYYSREAITATMSTLGITKYTADAILANFDQEKRVPLDGSLGVFFSINNPNKPTLASSANFGLPQAYNSILSNRILTIESLIDARLHASAVLIDSKTSTFKYTPFEFKDGVVIAGKAKNFSPHSEVLAKLEKYGYKLFTERIISEGKDQEVVKIDYGSKDKVLENLREFIRHLNLMINSGRDPYEAIAFAVQELLIIHPFKDGNGRIARILGQRLGEILLNDTLFFPKEFFREMNYSHQELVSFLRAAHQKSAEYRKSLEERRSEFLKGDLETYRLAASAPNWGTMSFYRMDGIKLKMIGDQSFESVIVKNGRIIDRNDLITKAPPHLLYFGAQRPNIRELYGSVRKYFESGRQIKGSNMYRNIDRHQSSKVANGTQDERNGGGEFSAFIQSSSSFEVATGFAGLAKRSSKSYGFVLIIDPRGAEVLELSPLTMTFQHEKEFVFDRKLDPRRIKGAILLINGKPFQTVVNPNYNYANFVSEKARETFD